MSPSLSAGQSAGLNATMLRAVSAAQEFEGRTAPNPPVGAVALDADGQVLATHAHAQAGLPHAEAGLIAALRAAKTVHRLHAVIVTLEPCNHEGRTPPCTRAILDLQRELGRPLRVIYGEHDPNPAVAGGGAAALFQAGTHVEQLSIPQTRALIAPFKKRVLTGMPWLTIKVALRETPEGDWSAIPLPGQKTFTTPESLREAHLLRRRADAILTGSGTWLADQPLFTVREVADHTPPPRRILWIFDRSRRISEASLAAARERGFEVILDRVGDPQAALIELGRRGALRALLEAGPQLTESVQKSGLWDERMVVRHPLSGPDQIQIERRTESESKF